MPPKLILPPPTDRYWRAYKTCIEMFIDRGYTISDEHQEITQETFTRDYIAQHAIVLEGIKEGTNERILAFFDIESETKTGVQILRDLSAFMEQNAINDAVIVSERGGNPMLLKELNQLNSKGFFIQFFCFIELYRNITHHHLVPLHRALTEEETLNICKQHKTTKNNFAHVMSKPSADGKLTADPVVKYYGFRKGTMIAIYRKLGGTMQPYWAYRVVY